MNIRFGATFVLVEKMVTILNAPVYIMHFIFLDNF
jgi:hypothetical protein